MTDAFLRICALSGGVGGAKLALGLSKILPADQLTIIANTGDDFEHLGLNICPDFDTLLYTLSGLSNPDQGWGRRDETWNFMASMVSLGGPDWFQLGDKDLGLHHARTERLKSGAKLEDIARELRQAFGLAAHLTPMSSDRVRTMLTTNRGELGFQEYFVREKCRPAVESIRFEGSTSARPADAFSAALIVPETIFVLCPSNPFLSLDPILSLHGVRARLQDKRTTVVGVSPIIAGAAVKGPTAKILFELDLEVSAAGYAAYYQDILTTILIDERDAQLAARIEDMGIQVTIENTLMLTEHDKTRLAGSVARAAGMAAQTSPA